MENEEVRNKLIELRADPSNMLRFTVNRLTEALNNVDVKGVSNPFMMSQESTVMCASAFMTHAESIARRVYPKLAITEEELYPHLTDKTLVERFAQPATCKEFVLIFNLDELKAKGVRDSISGDVKVVIPDTTILTNGVVPYGFYYNLEIIILKNGGIKTTWQGDLENGLKPLASNVVEHDIYKDINAGVNNLRLYFAADQYGLDVNYLNLNASGGNQTKVVLKDQYYTCVIWNDNPVTGKLERIRTTLSEQTYDPLKITAVLKVTDGILTVTIPAIYASNLNLGSTLRIDVYTTKGKYEHEMSEDSIDMFGYNFRDINGTYSTYSAALSSLSQIIFGSISSVTGGRDALSTNDLREKVIYANNDKLVPITPRDQSITLDSYGLTLTPIKDQVTEMTYLTSKAVSVPTQIPTSKSPIGIFNALTTLSTTELAALKTVAVNTDRLTLKPETLFVESNGVVELVTDARREGLSTLSDSDLVIALKQDNFVYTPFHYVLDSTNNFFSLGCYYLDAPSIEGRQYLEDNDTVPYILAPSMYSFTKVSTGYKLEVVVNKDSGLSGFSPADTFLQMAFTPSLSNGSVYLTGEYIGVTGENRDYVYRFMLDTSYIIDRNDAIHLTTFQRDDADKAEYPCPLEHEFHIYSGVYNWQSKLGPIGANYTDMDKEVKASLLDKTEYLVVSHEKIKLRFGDSLNRLYKPTRSVVSETTYEKYETDIYGWYDRTILEIDPKTDLPKIDMNNLADPFTVLHAKGDPVLDSDGNQRVLYPKGSTKYDIDGNPIPVKSSEVVQQAVLMMIDAKYRYCTDGAVIYYRDTIPLEIVETLESSIADIQSQLLGGSELYLAPQNNLGYVKVYDGDFVKSIPARQEPIIELWVSKDNYANTELRTSIEATCKDIVISALKGRQVSVSGIQKEIQDTLKGDIIGCLVNGLGVDRKLQAISVVDNDSTLALATELTIRSDGKLVIKDVITFKWVRFGDDN